MPTRPRNNTIAAVASILAGALACSVAPAHAALAPPPGNGSTAPAVTSAGGAEPLAAVLRQVSAGAARPIVIGTRGPTLTEFFDPSCTFCFEFYHALAPAIRAGELRVRYVLIGVIQPDSAVRAASILAARDPAKALAENEAGFHVRRQEGGYPVTAGARTSPYFKAVIANSATMEMAGGVGAPTLLYCSALTHALALHSGTTSTAAILAELAPARACRSG